MSSNLPQCIRSFCQFQWFVFRSLQILLKYDVIFVAHRSMVVELMKAKAALEKRDRDIEKENYDGFFNTLTDIIKKYGREVSGSQSNINQK